MTGDFNFPKEHINWIDTGECGAICEIKDKNSGADILKTFSQNNFLIQQIMAPTRNENILDLFFISNTEAINNIDVKEFPISDHRAVSVSTNIPTKQCLNTNGKEEL